MDTFFNILKKSLITTVFVAFGLVATYIPQPHGENININQNINQAEAFGGVSITFSPREMAQAIRAYAQGAAQLAQQAITAISAQWLVFKEQVLDGLMWNFAKNMLSNMMNSMIDWINTGFQGRPMFVEDVQGFLLETADRTFGEYIEDLGGLGSLICSPFRLDIQIALELEYQRSRMGQTAPTCTLTGILNNIDDFMSGTQDSFSQGGGWTSWIDITSQPQVYTPLGALYTAQQNAQIALTNSKGEEVNLLNYANGFMSKRECRDHTTVDGNTRTECSVVTPGKVVQEALSFNLDSGRQSLVEADEFDQFVSGFLGALLNQAFSQARGLLR